MSTVRTSGPLVVIGLAHQVMLPEVALPGALATLVLVLALAVPEDPLPPSELLPPPLDPQPVRARAVAVASTPAVKTCRRRYRRREVDEGRSLMCCSTFCSLDETVVGGGGAPGARRSHGYADRGRPLPHERRTAALSRDEF